MTYTPYEDKPKKQQGITVSLKPLTEEEISIKIGKAIGWEKCNAEVCERTGGCSLWWSPTADRSSGASSFLPDFCIDLNAMAEAEKTLTKEQRNIYVGCLMEKTAWSCFATARQRALAFIKTLEL